MKLVVAFWGANARRLCEFLDVISLGLDLDIPFYLVVCVHVIVCAYVSFSGFNWSVHPSATFIAFE